MSPDPDTWRGIGELAVFVGLGGYTAWKARRADQQTRSTGNGWAKDVKDRLDRIEDKLDEHLRDHADAGLFRRRR